MGNKVREPSKVGPFAALCLSVALFLSLPFFRLVFYDEPSKTRKSHLPDRKEDA